MKTLKQPAKALLTVGLLVGGIALAASLPFAFHHVGSFKRMSHTGDTAGQVAVSGLPQAAGTWGVGATADLKAEMIQIDGRLLVSPGSDDRGRVRPPEANEQALLWASGRVAAWAEVPVPRDMDQPVFETFVQEQARALGLSLDQPFPFRVTGAFPRLRWHVVTGEKLAGHGAHGAALEGVVSHPGERFHAHYVDDKSSVSGHVDAYAVAQGAVLMLPLR